MINKICVYAICKNESKFVKQWLDSMAEADYIVVLDTGSEDNTLELLQNDSRVTRVEQKIINPWRFDVARNESLKLVPDDANILVCTDLDEILHKGWAKKLKDNWIDGEHIRCYYKYIWSHDEEGNPGRTFWYDKIHSRNWYWKHPVHEMLVSDVYSKEDENNKVLQLFDEITLEHFPDKTKSRGSYLSLLKLRAEESPSDYYGLYYLSQEYFYRGYYYESINLLKDIYKNFKNCFTISENACLFLFLGDNYKALGKIQKAIFYYNKAIEIDKTYREPYVAVAALFNELGLYNVSIGYISDALKNSYRHYLWIERDTTWTYSIYDIASIAYFYLGDLKYALDCVDKAIEFCPNNERLLENRELILENINNPTIK